MTSINNLSIPAIVVYFGRVVTIVLHHSGSCLGHLLQEYLISIQLHSTNSTSLRFLKYCMRQKFSRLRNAWKLQGETSGEQDGWGSHSISRSFSFYRMIFARCELEYIGSRILPCCVVGRNSGLSIVIRRREWSRQFHFLQGYLSRLIVLSRRGNNISFLS